MFGRSRCRRRAAIVQLPAGGSVKITSSERASTSSRIARSTSAALMSRLESGTNASPRPVICPTADTIPAAKSPWPATSARAADSGSLNVFDQVLPNVNGFAHPADEALVERLGRIHAAVAQEMVHRDDFSDHGDVFPGVQEHLDLRQLDAEDRRRLGIEPRTVDDRVLIPLF